MCKLEIKRYKGRIIYRRKGEMVYYLDQLDWYDGIPYPNNPDELTWDDGWVAANYIDRYLQKWYNIDSRQYWNLIFGYDLDYYKPCDNKDCTNNSKFRSLWYGYHPTCSYECRDKVQSESMIEWYKTANPDDRQALINAQHSWWWTDRYTEFNDLFGNERSVLTRCKVVSEWNFKKFLQLGNIDDECYFYIAKTVDKFKFGVSTNDINYGWDKNYLKYKVILSNTRFYVSILEYLIKLDLNLDTEYIDWIDVPRFINSYVKNLKYLQTQGSTTIEQIRSQFV